MSSTTGCKCDFKKCRKDCECRCHLLAEAHATHSFRVGEYSGMDQAAGILLGEASQEFMRGQDDAAQALRKLSEKLRAKAKTMHPGPDVKYPEEA